MSEAPWLDIMRQELGVKEVAGKGANPRIREYFASVGHPEVTSDEISWCAASAGYCLKTAGYPIPPVETNLMGMSYTTYGRKLTEFQPGAICTFYYTKLREKDWRRHVAIGIEETETRIKVIGGNQGNEVSERWFSKKDLVAMRWPVKATVEDLRQSGSTDIKMGDRLQNAGIGTAVTTAVGAGANAVLTPVDPPAASVLQQTAEHTGFVTTIIEGASRVGTIVGNHPWILGVALAAGLAWWLGGKIKAHRVKRAEQGHALSQAG